MSLFIESMAVSDNTCLVVGPLQAPDQYYTTTWLQKYLLYILQYFRKTAT